MATIRARQQADGTVRHTAIVRVVLRAAKSVDGIAVRPEVVQEARTACRELRSVGKTRRRERRPTEAELIGGAGDWPR